MSNRTIQFTTEKTQYPLTKHSKETNNLTTEINCTFINVNSLNKKCMYPEFSEFIHNYDIISFAETKCNDTLSIPNFNCFTNLEKILLASLGE